MDPAVPLQVCGTSSGKIKGFCVVIKDISIFCLFKCFLLLILKVNPVTYLITKKDLEGYVF